jgi:Putative zinc- or iron-chelating domain
MTDDDDAAAPQRTARATLVALEELRSDLHALAAQVVALAEQVVAAAADPKAADATLAARTRELLPAIALADAMNEGRIQLGNTVDKYQVSNADGPPCLELLPICGGRCCALTFPLSTQDLDEGVIKWDHGRPYLIRHDDDGRCSHQRRPTGDCGCYQHRPAPCRSYDCRNDPRIWTDFTTRQLAPAMQPDQIDSDFRHGAVREREFGLLLESLSVRRRQ